MKLINIWDENAPVCTEDKGFTPYMTFHKAENPINKTVLVCPGGAYGWTADDHEGIKVAEFYNSFGADVFVLRYTTTRRNNEKFIYPLPYLDATRAMRYIRANAEKFDINPNCLGIMGFSAGGHLAGWVSTKWNENLFDVKNSVKRYDDLFGKVSARPDFSVLVYAVNDLYKYIDYGITGRQLLGDNATDEMKESLCNQNNVTKDTPPTFLYHTMEDASVPCIASIKYYEAMIKNGVPGEIHIFQPGCHGLALIKDLDFVKKDHPKVYEYSKNWGDLLKNWVINKVK